MLAVTVLLTCGCGSYGWRDKTIPQLSDEKAPELEPLIRQRCVPFVEKGKSVGLAVAVVSPTREAILTFGRPAIASTAEVRSDSLYEIGSITKTFTALALQREIERGTVRLDQPVAELLPVGMTLPPKARGVTVRQLTTHTSGFPALPGNFSMWHVLGKMLVNGNPYDGYSEADFREGVRTVKLESKPGTTFSYSNFGMDLLGYILAQRAGVDYETYIKREVCQPLGLYDTTVTFTSDQAKRFVQGYTDVEMFGRIMNYDRAAPWNLPSHLAGSGALRSSAADMLIYLKANMRPQGPLAHAIRETHRELFHDEDGLAIGMNWILSPSDSIGKTIVWHDGETGGYCTYLGFTEDGQVGVVILSNVAEDVDDLGEGILTDLAKASEKTPTVNHK
jgi:CubicO group peptidase (beta-lactamase class C family)